MSSTRSVRIRWALILTAALAATLLAASELASAPRDYGSPDLEIDSFSTQIDNGRVTAEVSVENTTRTRLRGVVWWLL